MTEDKIVSKINLPGIIPIEQLSADTNQLYEILNEESDLACVLISVAFLDEALSSFLHAKFREHSSISDKLLDSRNGAFGNFAARTDLAYCLSLIGKEQYNDLRKLGEIRNLFAHSHLRFSFGELRAQELCNQLRQWRFIEDEKDAPVNLSLEQLQIRARNQFKLSVVILAARILVDGLGLK